MVTTTLPNLPGLPFTPVGVVAGIAFGPLQRGDTLEAARLQMEAQAEALGADAVIDVRVQVVPTSNPPGPDALWVAFTGTAIKFTH